MRSGVDPKLLGELRSGRRVDVDFGSRLPDAFGWLVQKLLAETEAFGMRPTSWHADLYSRCLTS